MASKQRRTDDLLRLKTRGLIYQNPDGSYPAAESIPFVVDTSGTIGFSPVSIDICGNMTVPGNLTVHNTSTPIGFVHVYASPNTLSTLLVPPSATTMYFTALGSGGLSSNGGIGGTGGYIQGSVSVVGLQGTLLTINVGGPGNPYASNTQILDASSNTLVRAGFGGWSYTQGRQANNGGGGVFTSGLAQPVPTISPLGTEGANSSEISLTPSVTVILSYSGLDLPEYILPGFGRSGNGGYVSISFDSPSPPSNSLLVTPTATYSHLFTNPIPGNVYAQYTTTTAPLTSTNILWNTTPASNLGTMDVSGVWTCTLPGIYMIHVTSIMTGTLNVVYGSTALIPSLITGSNVQTGASYTQSLAKNDTIKVAAVGSVAFDPSNNTALTFTRIC